MSDGAVVYIKAFSERHAGVILMLPMDVGLPQLEDQTRGFFFRFFFPHKQSIDAFT